MKKLTLFIIIVLIVNTGLLANNAELFLMNESSMNNKLSALQVLENYVISENGITLTQIENENNPALENLNLINTAGNPFAFSGEDWNWGVFALGVGTGVGLCLFSCGFAYDLAILSLLQY